ncbi:MAG: TerB family tellurite resistance protein [Alphaproteobacteria bacterium]
MLFKNYPLYKLFLNINNNLYKLNIIFNKITKFKNLKKLSNFSNEIEVKYSIFNFCFIALAAKLAKTDGNTNMLEANSLADIYPLNTENKSKIKEIFYSAQKDKQSAEYYVIRVLLAFPSNNNLYEELIANLIKIALIDGPLNIYEEEWFYNILPLFGINKDKFKILLKQEFLSSYILFNNNKKLNLNELNSAYKDVVKNCHPDSLLRYNKLSNDYIALMIEKFNIATHLYTLRKKNL